MISSTPRTRHSNTNCDFSHEEILIRKLKAKVSRLKEKVSTLEKQNRCLSEEARDNYNMYQKSNKSNLDLYLEFASMMKYHMFLQSQRCQKMVALLKTLQWQLNENTVPTLSECLTAITSWEEEIRKAHETTDLINANIAKRMSTENKEEDNSPLNIDLDKLSFIIDNGLLHNNYGALLPVFKFLQAEHYVQKSSLMQNSVNLLNPHHVARLPPRLQRQQHQPPHIPHIYWWHLQHHSNTNEVNKDVSKTKSSDYAPSKVDGDASLNLKTDNVEESAKNTDTSNNFSECSFIESYNSNPLPSSDQFSDDISIGTCGQLTDIEEDFEIVSKRISASESSYSNENIFLTNSEDTLKIGCKDLTDSTSEIDHFFNVSEEDMTHSYAGTNEDSSSSIITIDEDIPTENVNEENNSIYFNKSHPSRNMKYSRSFYSTEDYDFDKSTSSRNVTTKGAFNDKFVNDLPVDNLSIKSQVFTDKSSVNINSEEARPWDVPSKKIVDVKNEKIVSSNIEHNPSVVVDTDDVSNRETSQTPVDYNLTNIKNKQFQSFIQRNAISVKKHVEQEPKQPVQTIVFEDNFRYGPKFEQLLRNLKCHLPKACESDLLLAATNIRRKNNGRLTGMLFEDILTQVKRELKYNTSAFDGGF